MKARLATFAASWIGRLVMVAALIGAAWWIVSSLSGGKSARVEADLNGNRAGAAVESGADAANTTGDVADRAADIDGKVSDARSEIDRAETGDDIDAAGRDGLCDLSPDYCR